MLQVHNNSNRLRIIQVEVLTRKCWQYKNNVFKAITCPRDCKQSIIFIYSDIFISNLWYSNKRHILYIVTLPTWKHDDAFASQIKLCIHEHAATQSTKLLFGPSTNQLRCYIEACTGAAAIEEPFSTVVMAIALIREERSAGVVWTLEDRIWECTPSVK